MSDGNTNIGEMRGLRGKLGEGRVIEGDLRIRGI